MGWTVAGHALSPLKRILSTTQRVSEDRLDERIDLDGPDDELRELADTFDSMLDRLARSFEDQRRFVANASHELRSPLTVIRTEAEVALAGERLDPDELEAVARVVVAESKRTEALLDGLMILARSQRGLTRRDRADLADGARAAAATVAAEARAENVRLTTVLAPAPVTGDRALLERLVANLVENAVRHNHPGGWARVTTRVEDDHAVVAVTSSGASIADEDVRRLTEPFERLDRGVSGTGVGLGLSIVRAVAQAHGGELALSARERGGLEVNVRLPSHRRATTSASSERLVGSAR